MKSILPTEFVKVITTTHFPKLWVSQILSLLTLNLINFILILRIFEATGSSIAVSLVWLFYAMPAIILGPISGTIIDLASRRKLLIATNITQAFTVLFYLPAKEALWPIYTVIFAYSALNQIYVPAEAATLPSLVSAKLLPAANTIFVFTLYAMFLLGVGAAGPLVEAVGRNTPFVFMSLLLFLAAWAVWQLPKDRKSETVRNPGELWQRFVEGFQFIKEQPQVLFPLLLLVFAGILLPVIAVLSPAITVNLLGIPLLQASTRIIVPGGIGAIAGAIFVVKVAKRLRKKKLISFGLFLMGAFFILIGLVIPIFTNRAFLTSIASVFLGFAFALTLVPTQTLLQEQTPNELRGRVFGALNFLITLASLVPVLFAATLAEFLGVQTLLVIIAGILFLAAYLSANSERILRLYQGRNL